MKFRKILNEDKLYQLFVEHVIVHHDPVVFIGSTILFGLIFTFRIAEANYYIAGFSVFFLIERVLIYRITRREQYPYEILSHDSSVFRPYVVSLVVTILIIVMVPVLGYFSVLSILPLLVGLLLWGFFFAFSYLLLSFIYLIITTIWLIYASHYHPLARTRLCLKVTSDALCNLPTDKNLRAEFVRERIRWFREGLRTCNRYLFLRHKGLQIQSIDEYHNVVHLTALVGNPDEVTSLNEKVLMVMNSFPEKERHCDLRNLLTSLRSISGKRVKSLADLTAMTRTVTLPSVIAEVLVKYVVPLSASAALFYYLWQITLKAVFHV